MPTISSNCLSLSSSRSSLPSPQPRSSTRLAPLARSAARTAPSRCSFRLSGFSRTSSAFSSGRCSSSSALDRLLLLHEPGEGHAVQARLELQVAAGDLFLLGVAGQPALALGEQLLHLVLADEVVLAVVEHRDQDVEVRQQVRERGRLADGDREVRTLAPLGEAFVQRIADGLDLVAQRLEDASQEPLAAAHRQHVDPGRRAGSPMSASSGRSLQRPWRAEPKTWAIATLMNDEAA